MFSLSDLKNTKFYQEAFEEGLKLGKEEVMQQWKIESTPRLQVLGLSSEQIAQALDLSLETVNKTLANYQDK